MGNLTFLHKLCISVCWGLLLMYTAAERQYFISSHNASWADARNHCQVCFKEMVTLTPENAHIIAKIINSTHWIGLRKYINYNDTYNETDDYVSYYYNSTNTSSKSFGTPWTRWANGDPLSFQNWYPGFPLFKSPLPKIDCCSCSCTCPAPPRTTTTAPTVTSPSSTGSTTGFPTGSVVPKNSSGEPTEPKGVSMNVTDWANFTQGANFTGAGITQAWESSTANAVHTTATAVHTTDSPWTTTPQLPIFSTCERSPMLPPVIPENNKNYIENSCVVVLAFGPWVERECFEKLPFICYEDRFMGAINISKITSSSAALQWDQGPGDISHYRFEAFSRDGSWNVTEDMHYSSYTLVSLTPGTGYVVKVFAVKCDRDLNPLSGSFYTIPGEVQDLHVTNFTETTVSLSWTKPKGNYGFFEVIAVPAVGIENHNKTVKEENMVFDGLTQGTKYNFIFATGVQDRSMWSENISISNCTLPGKVSNLIALENKDTGLTLQWDPPEGNYKGFKVMASGENGILDVNVTNLTNLLDKPYKVIVSGLQNGTKYYFSVKVSGVCGLEGKIENITAYTAPGPVSGLKMTATANSINASWDFIPNPGSDVKYRAWLFVIPLSSILDDKGVKIDTGNKTVKFENLKSSTPYEVKVYVVLNNLESPVQKASIFTLPNPPSDAKVSNSTKGSLTFEWKPPKDSSATEYNCTLYSEFWDVNPRSNKVKNTTMCSFTGLKSGSTYAFNVYTVSANETSSPASCSGTTEKDPVEIGLSMLCSSGEPLYCEEDKTRNAVFMELQKYFRDILEGKVYYDVQTIPPKT